MWSGFAQRIDNSVVMRRNIDVETSVMEALILSQIYKVPGFMGVRH